MVHIPSPLGRLPIGWAVVAAISASSFSQCWFNSEHLALSSGLTVRRNDPFKKVRWAVKPVLLLWGRDPFPQQQTRHTLTALNAAWNLMWTGDLWRGFQKTWWEILWPQAKLSLLIQYLCCCYWVKTHFTDFSVSTNFKPFLCVR